MFPFELGGASSRFRQDSIISRTETTISEDSGPDKRVRVMLAEHLRFIHLARVELSEEQISIELKLRLLERSSEHRRKERRWLLENVSRANIFSDILLLEASLKLQKMTIEDNLIARNQRKAHF